MDLRRLAKGAATAQRMRELARRRGIAPGGGKLWTEREDAIIRKFAPVDYPSAHKRLPHRSRRAIVARSFRLGTSRPRRPWLGSEVALLKKVYPVASLPELRARFPNCELKRLHRKAFNLGLKRPRLWKKVGHPLVDGLRSRAAYLNMSMRDVEAFAGTKGHFHQTHRLLRQNAEKNHIARAVEALGGRLVIEWDD